MPEHRSMVFVDGENVAIEGAKLIQDCLPQQDTKESPFYERDTFLWLPTYGQARRLDWYGFNSDLFPPSIRSFYFTTYSGNDNTHLGSIRSRLKALDFDVEVFLKVSGKSKYVDIKLTTTALHHAYQGHYDTAFLFAGDADYIPLIEELKQIGKRVHVLFFSDCTAQPIKDTADRFIPVEDLLTNYWKLHATRGVAIQRVPLDTGQIGVVEMPLEEARLKFGT